MAKTDGKYYFIDHGEGPDGEDAGFSLCKRIGEYEVPIYSLDPIGTWRSIRPDEGQETEQEYPCEEFWEIVARFHTDNSGGWANIDDELFGELSPKEQYLIRELQSLMYSKNLFTEVALLIEDANEHATHE